MSAPQNCEPDMSEVAAIVRTVYPGHALKRVAGVMNAPLDTVRTWLYRRLSASRRRELALALLAELDRQDAERACVRRQLGVWAAGAGDEMDRVLAEPAADADRPETKYATHEIDRPSARAVGG